MSDPRLLPLLDAPPVERRDAARNRELLLAAAQRLVETCGAAAVTMDAVAAVAGAGAVRPSPAGPRRRPVGPAAGLRTLPARDDPAPGRPDPRRRVGGQPV